MYNMQNYNSGFGRYVPSFNAYQQPYYNYGQLYNQPQMQQPIQQNQTQQQMPIQAVRFLNADEIKGWAVQPNTSEMLIDRANKRVTIKSADVMGESTIKTYSYSSLEETPVKETTPQYLTKEDLTSYATKDDIKGISDLLQQLKQGLTKKPEGDFSNGKQG